MPEPFICVYCRQPIVLHRDNYVLLAPEDAAGGDYRPAHLACAEGPTGDAEVHASTGDRELTGESFETVYVTHLRRYRFALLIPRMVPDAVRRGLALFRLWRTGQAPQDGVVLTLPELTSLHEDLGRLREYLQRERTVQPPRHPPQDKGEGPS